MVSLCSVSCGEKQHVSGWLACRAELVASTRERSAAQDCTQIGTITHILKTLEEREHEYL